MRGRGVRPIGVIGLALWSGIAQPALAVDGVVEINQATVMAGDITPGDRADFPVSITVPGSYRLTSDLVHNPQAGPLIIVDANHVTLDLNGFSLVGGASCGAAGGICTPIGQAGFDGVYANTGAHNLTVRNGVVRGVIGAGLELQGLAARVIDVRVIGNANGGARIGPYCSLSGVFALSNGTDGIYIAEGCALTNSTANGNRLDGIEVTGPAGGGSSVRESVAVGNGGRGIAVCGGAVVSDNEVSRNLIGIEIGTGNSLTTNCTAVGEVKNNRVATNGDGVFVSYGASAHLVGNTILGNYGTGLKVDGGFLSIAAFAAYGSNVIRGNLTADVDVGFVLTGFAETIQIAPNVCGTDTTCP